MTQLNALEKSLVKINKDLPALPKGLKDFLVQVAPWLTLLGGIFGAWAAYQTYRWANATNGLVDYANSISQLYGGDKIATDRFTVTLWISIAVLAVTAVIYLLAFNGLKDKKKSGWDLLFLATIVSLVGAIVSLFTDYSYSGGFFGGLIGTAISWYVLFQIRGYYTGDAKVTPTASAKK